MSARVKFAQKPDKLVETMLYLSLKGMKLDQYQVVKLLYLADRAHLIRFGRPITFDRYVAMKFGPVGSAAYDLLKGKSAQGIAPSELPFDIRKHDEVTLLGKPKREIKKSVLSKSDLLILDSIIKEFGGMTFDQLFKITHEHFAYDRAWKNRSSGADEMRYEDFFPENADKESRVSDLEFIAKAM